MRNLISVALVLAMMSATFVGCSSSNNDEVDTQTTPPIEESFDDLVYDFEDDMEDLFEENSYMYQDGVYRAEYIDYYDGYKDYVEIAVKDSEIYTVDYNGLDESGKLKSLDEDFKTRYLTEYETYPSEFMPIYSNHLVQKQTLDGLEVYKGTDKDYESFKRLAEQALDNAKIGNKEVSSVDSMMDTTMDY